jgi:hypothetical protein
MAIVLLAQGMPETAAKTNHAEKGILSYCLQVGTGAQNDGEATGFPSTVGPK